MSIRKRLFKRKLIQARDAGKDLQLVVPRNMKNKKLLKMAQEMQAKVKK